MTLMVQGVGPQGLITVIMTVQAIAAVEEAPQEDSNNLPINTNNILHIRGDTLQTLDRVSVLPLHQTDLVELVLQDQGGQVEEFHQRIQYIQVEQCPLHHQQDLSEVQVGLKVYLSIKCQKFLRNVQGNISSHAALTHPQQGQAEQLLQSPTSLPKFTVTGG